MKPLCYIFAILSLISAVISGCTNNQHSKNKCGPCPEYPVLEPNIIFSVVDKTTMHDLFFGPGAPYKINQLSMHHIVNGKPDTLILNADTTNKVFHVYVNTMHAVDTVTMNVANKPQDVLLFNTSNTGGCCPRLVLSSVSFNGTTVYTNTNGGAAVVLKD